MKNEGRGRGEGGGEWQGLREGWRGRVGTGGGWATGVAADSRLVVVVAEAEGGGGVAGVVAAAAAAANIKSLAHAWCIH